MTWLVRHGWLRHGLCAHRDLSVILYFMRTLQLQSEWPLAIFNMPTGWQKVCIITINALFNFYWHCCFCVTFFLFSCSRCHTVLRLVILFATLFALWSTSNMLVKSRKWRRWRWICISQLRHHHYGYGVVLCALQRQKGTHCQTPKVVTERLKQSRVIILSI